MAPYTCVVANCFNTSGTPNLEFYLMPTAGDDRYERWLYLVGRPELLKRKGVFHICEIHFSPFDLPSKDTKFLVPRQDPSLHLPASRPRMPDEMSENHHKGVQCKLDKKQKFLPSMSLVDVERKKLSKQVNHKIVFDQLCDSFFPKHTAEMIKTQVDIKTILNRDKCNTDYRHFCMHLYHTSPANYIALQKTLQLPSKKELIYSCRGSISKGLTTLLKTLKPRIDCLSDLGKNCIVLISLVELKPHLYYHIREDKLYGFCESDAKQKSEVARYALTCMVRGIYEQWTLPVDYALFYTKDNHLNSAMSKWIHLTILELIGAGLKVRACMSNLRTSAIAAVENQPEVTEETPFFLVDDDTKLYYVYDPTYLMINVYRYLLDHEFHFENSVAKWQDVIQFYESDSKKEHRLAPELTEKHIRPNADRIEARIAVETLSERVAAGISTYVDFGQMDASAKGTVHLLTMMSKFYKFMNSSNASKSWEGQSIQDFIMDALTFFQKLKVFKDSVEVTHEVKVTKQLQISIRATMLLFKDLTAEKLPYLQMNNIRFNVMSDFLNQIVEKSKTKDITAWRLICAYRKMVLKNVLKPSDKATFPELVSGIIKEYLGNASSGLKEPPVYQRSSIKMSNLSLPVKKTDYENFKLPAENQLIPICTFLLEKCWEWHSLCSLFKFRKPDRKYTLFDRFYGDQNSPAVFVPDDHFVDFVKALDEELQKSFKRYFMAHRLFVLVEDCEEDLVSSSILPCPCFPVQFMTKLFFRLRISQQLKMNNKRFRESSDEELIFLYYNLI